MSFVTFSQRTSISTTRTTRSGASRILQIPAHRTINAMQELLREQVLWKRQQNRFRSTHADLREYRVFHKYMRKIGIEIPVRNIRQYISRLMSFYKVKASEFPGRTAHPSPSKSHPQAVGLHMPKLKTCAHKSFDLYTNPRPDTLGELAILEPSLRFVDPLPSNTRMQPTLSMSCRRYAANIPTLQGHLSFVMPRFLPTHRSSDDGTLEALFPIDPRSTPITPSDKIMHTPLYPPSLKHPDVKRIPSDTSVEIADDCPTYLRTTSRYLTPGNTLFKVSESIRRRLSVVSPPEAKLMHAPRRLSYSHTYGKSKSPFKRRAIAAPTEPLNSYAEMSVLLASPLVIIPSSSNRQLDSAAWIDNSRYSGDFSFSSRESPVSVKV